MQKYIHRVRLQVTTTLGILSNYQSLFADKMSHIVVHESSDFDETSSDDELQQDIRYNDLYLAGRQMLASGTEIDERFISMYLVRKAKE